MTRQELLKRVMIADFAIDDLKLYLDTHPMDQTALSYYRKYQDMSAQADAAYTAEYGPLTAEGNDTANGWTWIDNPCPWDMEA